MDSSFIFILGAKIILKYDTYKQTAKFMRIFSLRFFSQTMQKIGFCALGQYIRLSLSLE